VIGRQRTAGQSMVEMALVAPILILLAMAVWDGGSALREQVVLEQAARDGARVAATGFGTAVLDTTVGDAVVASAADLPALRNTPGYLTISYPNPQAVRVQVKYAHVLITPVLRQVWSGGQGSLLLQASATFYLPTLTPVPATLTPAPATVTPTPTVTPTVTPMPTVTPTITPTPTVTPTVTPSAPTATSTPTLVNPCSVSPAAQTIQSLANNSGYWCTLRIAVSSRIGANWQDLSDSNNDVRIYSTSPDPFAGRPDPVAGNYLPNGQLADTAQTGSSISALTAACQPVGIYSVYFFNHGVGIPTTSGSVTIYPC
jgi:Flp pilus assembly protein TadG